MSTSDLPAALAACGLIALVIGLVAWAAQVVLALAARLLSRGIRALLASQHAAWSDCD